MSLIHAAGSCPARRKGGFHDDGRSGDRQRGMNLAISERELGAMIGALVAERPPMRPVMGDPTDPLSSFDLLIAAKDGDSEALGLLYERYLPRLRRFGHGRLPLLPRRPGHQRRRPGRSDPGPAAHRAVRATPRGRISRLPPQDAAEPDCRSGARAAQAARIAAPLDDVHPWADPSQMDLLIGPRRSSATRRRWHA